MLKSIDTKVEDKGIDESKVRQGRLHAGTGKCESTASWSSTLGRAESKRPGKRATAPKKASDRSRPDNE
jgi:hypothetical protein